MSLRARRSRLVAGERAPAVRLPGLDGAAFDTASLARRRFMLSFFRFASCPFCNLRIHHLVQRFGEFGDGFTIVAVFDSPLDNLVRHASGHKAPFAILADTTGEAYATFGIEQSVLGTLKGMVSRAPALMQGMAMGYVPTSFKGNITTMPADFLVDEHGIIQTAHYGADEGDHLPFETVVAFSNAS